MTNLNIANNTLTYVDKDAFRYCNLQEINFSFNKLAFNNTDNVYSPFKYCSNLQIIDLSNNFIDKVFNDWKKNEKLLKLFLNNNSIKYIKVYLNLIMKILVYIVNIIFTLSESIFLITYTYESGKFSLIYLSYFSEFGKF